MAKKVRDEEDDFENELGESEDTYVEESTEESEEETQEESTFNLGSDDDDIEIVIEIDEDELDITKDDKTPNEEVDETEESDIVLSKHKIEGKHSLKYDSIFKGKKEDPLSEDDLDGNSTYYKETIEVDKSSIYHHESIDNEVRMAASDIYKEGNRMEKLVNSLLNLSRIDLGKIQFNAQAIYLDKYIDSLLKTLQLDINAKNISFEVDIAFTQPIKNDPIYLDIIIINILHNAIKYSNKGSIVKLKVDSLPNTEKFIIKVSDTGIGIPESQQSQIFGRLFRADNAKNCQPDGNGLGLYVVKKLIELMDGNVWFESKENQGTTFFLELPIDIK